MRRRTWPTGPAQTPAGCAASNPPGVDEPHYEPTPAVETAAAFCRDLGPREFVGTASRLLTVRDLLRQITAGAAADPADRLAALLRQREEIDSAIERLRSGADLPMDPTAVRERYAQVVSTARTLLADMRSVEERMRELDRSVRARVTAWDGPRGELLETVFGSRDSIRSSDQGRSWQAFWEFLLSARAQAELDELLDQTHSVPVLAGRSGEADTLLRTDLFHAAEATQRTVASLSAQLRRFLDDNHWAEERRVASVICGLLVSALTLVERGQETRTLTCALTDLRADLHLPLERPLYTPRLDADIDTAPNVPQPRRSPASREAMRWDGPTALSAWWRDHADHHMAVLTNRQGPFHACLRGHAGPAPASTISRASSATDLGTDLGADGPGAQGESTVAQARALVAKPGRPALGRRAQERRGCR